MATEMSQRIVDAAGEVFAEQGLGATLADVARRAGVGVATVYRRFANKDELILALFADRFAYWEQQARRAAESEDAWAGFVHYFEESTEALVRDRGFRELVTGAYTATAGWSRGTGPDRLYALFAQTEAAMREHHVRLVRRAQDAGVLRRDIAPSDMLVLTMAVQATVSLAATARRPDIYRRILGVVLDGLRPSRRGPTPLPVEALTDDDLHPAPPTSDDLAVAEGGAGADQTRLTAARPPRLRPA
jgi:AcrR family transcriptional regulator